MKKLVIFGGSFNPPGNHHRAIAEALAGEFDDVVVVPCGPRDDKPAVDVEPIYRATMVDMAFRGIPRVRVELFDLESKSFTRAIELEKKFSGQGEVWHLIGTDLIRGGAKGESLIQKEWAQGATLWKNSRFVVAQRPGFTFDTKDLPPHHSILKLREEGSSSRLRDWIFHGKSIEGMVAKDVLSYIQRHELYRGKPARRTTRLQLDEIRPMIVVDSNNPEAQRIASSYPLQAHERPNVIIVIGGDGAMLRAIRRHWRLRLPFFGVNAGHLGFLLNDRFAPIVSHREFALHQLPLLWVETESIENERQTDVAFNDAWVERSSGQTGLIAVSVNGRERIPRLMADAALVSTAAGSGSYARAMGATPLPFNTPTLLLVGSNVLQPPAWKSAVLTLDAEVEFRSVDSVRRPLNGFIDGVGKGPIRWMKIRLSHTASVELLFDPAHDPSEKLAKIQFPQLDGKL